PQLGHIAANPVPTRIDSRDPPPRHWILGVAQSIPHEPPNIELVAQDTRPTERMSADCCVAPRTAAGTRCALSVEFGGDPTRALPCGKIRKDATNHCRFGLKDLAATALAVLDDRVTIAKSST